MAKSYETEIPKGDWLKVDLSAMGPDVQAAAKSRDEANATAREARERFESVFAARLVESGQIPEGRLPIFSRFGQLADPSKHTKEAGKSGNGKKTFTLAKIVTAAERKARG